MAARQSDCVPGLIHETQVGYPRETVAGVDEVGRGCIAGPVVAGAVLLPPTISFQKDPWLKEIRDSKKLTAPVREKLAPLIRLWAAAWAIGVCSVEEIDRINIFQASHLAMVRAIHGLKSERPVGHILVDGKFLPKQGLKSPATAVIQGDLKCLSIAAASILAKVYRDQLMTDLDSVYPGYGLAQHKGYPTPAHSRALAARGVTDIHRKSFSTVAQLSL